VRTTLVTLAVLFSILVTHAAARPALSADAPSDDAKDAPREKGQPATVADLRGKLKAGTFKLTEGEVVKLLGRPAGVKRPGDTGSELRMHWEYGTYIFATFKDGKLAEVTGAFSENLPVERINLANLKRLRVGMTEAEVVDVLGPGNGTVKADATTTRSWGRNARLWVSFNAKGLAFGEGFHEESAIAAPPGIQIPIPGAVKP